MKYIITAVFICLVFSGKAQKLETLPSGLLNSGSVSINFSTGTVRSGTVWIDSTYKPIYDTIPVIMLCGWGDTTRTVSKIDIGTGVITKDTIRGLDERLWQMRGYEIRAVTTANNWDGIIDPWMTLGWKPQSWKEYEHIAFLDQYKHPLEKYIIVWQTHPL